MYRALRKLFHDYEWVHTILGIIGNTSFLVGSILFFWKQTKETGVWLFVFGASGMLIASIGTALVKAYERERGS